MLTRTLACLIGLLVAPGLHAAWTAPVQVQQWNFTDSATSETINVASTVAAGSFLAILYSNGTTQANVITSVTDTGCGGSGWTVDNDTTRGHGVAWTYCTNGLTTSNTFTLNWTNSNFNYKWGVLVKASGSATSSILDAVATKATTFTGSAVTVPLVTTADNVLILALIRSQTQTYTVGGGFTEISNQSLNGNDYYVYRIATTAGTYDPAGTVAGATDYSGRIASFKEAGGAPPATARRLVVF